MPSKPFIARSVETFLVKGSDEEMEAVQVKLQANYPGPWYHITGYKISNDETVYSIWRISDLI